MPKRKRADPDVSAADEPSDNGRATAKQRKQLPPRLEQGKKALNKALKISRGFERQKLSRRRKTAEKEGKEKDVERIDAEIAALKKLDYHVLAEAHLYKTLLKIKSIKEHPALPPWIKLPEGPKVDTATMNVQARLFNANPTKEAMDAIVKDVRSILELDTARGPKAKRARSESEEESAAEKKKKRGKAKEETAEDDEESSDEGKGADKDGEDDEWDSEDFEGFSDRIAASSDFESEEEGMSELKKSYKPVRDLSFTPPSSREASPSQESTPDPTFSDSASGSPEPAPKTRAKMKAPVVENKSTFLPSLSAVGYISGSESEPEDLEDQIAPPRKNRRGQRARQQLWEKKYGNSAKHLAKKKEKEKNDRNAGWDAKRGAVDRDGSKGKGKFGRDKGMNRSGRGPKATDANTVELGKKKDHRDDSGKLHPSWEAAKLAKEKAKLNNVQFQGKKVTFD
ncbi:putative cellular morphogenesis protein [Macrophomina phaseolina]|uniref:Cellular morphogenesis protein n=1 Tax=Macrophomina phaseolina TaxID=35725 RepID=A0ABQ8FS16_9PEZI|nr:putative cellular morphogenesis protein [Macrophomina phaseolina]